MISMADTGKGESSNLSGKLHRAKQTTQEEGSESWTVTKPNVGQKRTGDEANDQSAPNMRSHHPETANIAYTSGQQSVGVGRQTFNQESVQTKAKEIYAELKQRQQHRDVNSDDIKEIDHGDAQHTRGTTSHCRVHQQPGTCHKAHRLNCAHHNPNCHKHHHHHHQHSGDHSPPAAQSTRINHGPGRLIPAGANVDHRHPKQPQDHPYLLVEYRPPNALSASLAQDRGLSPIDLAASPKLCAPIGSVNSPAAAQQRRTTAGFISQLYFLLHLSAIISLLLHHNSLVSSERKHLIFRRSQHPSHEQQGDTSLAESGISSWYPNGSFSNTSASSPPPSIVGDSELRPLPVPQVQKASDNQLAYQLIAGPPKSQRLPRTLANLVPLSHPLNQPDLLVRLMGWWHAKHALQYLLCYLLSSSITILICLWLLRQCSRKRRTPTHSSAILHRAITAAQQIPYYRTRLADCTPVLIGSISLGLIQLIVVGLDIADNVDWLTGAESRWPIYLPFLQFAFVSLLMQFILAQVAKNHELEELGDSDKRNFSPLRISANDFAHGRGRFALSINKSGGGNIGSNFEAGRLSPPDRRAPASSADMRSDSPISDGLQNIALAHLLVTHILLWLMKLNSISLIQPIEHHSHQDQFHNSANQFHHSPPFASIPRTHLSPPTAASTPAPTLQHKISARHNSTQQVPLDHLHPPSISGHAPDNHLHNATISEPPTLASTSTEFKSKDKSPPPPPLEHNNDEIDRERQFNRTRLESILRRKVPRLENHVTSTLAPSLRPHSPASVTSSPPPPPVVAVGEPTHRDLEPVKVVVPLVESTPSPVGVGVNQRGLRSTAKAHPSPPLATTVSPSTSDGHGGDEPILARDQPADDNSTKVTMTRAELMNLIQSLKHNDKGAEPKSDQPEPKLSGPSANMTSHSYKSSLPKRMTAFRQSRPKLLSTLPPVSTTSTNAPTTDSTTSPPIPVRDPLPPPNTTHRPPMSTSRSPLSPSFTSTSTSTSAPVRIKQKARVVVSRSEDTTEDPIDLSTVIPAVKAVQQERAMRAPGSTTTDLPAPTSERPFPSVESDIPQEDTSLQHPPDRGHLSTTYPRSTSTASNRQPLAPRASTTLRPPITSRGQDDYTSTVAPSTDEEEQNSESGNEEDPSSADVGGEGEEAEVDLDALLPPVPNYNDTEETSNSGREGRQLNLTAGGPGAIIVTNSSLDEEPFSFNEAATVIKLNVSADTPSLRLNVSVERPRSERLVSEERPRARQDHAPPLPTFAEYLLPIVHQYHILIIAILFHMWLDSLCRHRSPFAGVNSNPPGACLPSRHTNARRLIAIPISRNGKPKLKAESSQLLGNRTFFNGHQIARLAAHNQRRQQQQPGRSTQPRHRSRSTDYLNSHLIGAANDESNESGAEGLSRRDSLRSFSSEHLLWVPHRATGGARNRSCSSSARSLQSAGTLSQSATSGDSRLSTASFARLVAEAAAAKANSHSRHLKLEYRQTQQVAASTSSVCSVFFGLLVVSASLIVMLLGVDLLSMLTQCLTQVLSVLVCLLGLCVVWRHRRRAQIARSRRLGRPAPGEQSADNHRHGFHYLFLLAAYYCGLATALNLGAQSATEQQLFSQQVVQFVQRHLAPADSMRAPAAALNYTLMFHFAVALKGLVLVVQVTLQTVLIRASSWRQSRCELRQIYTFLMFANLSLWAMDICEQQQHQQHSRPEPSIGGEESQLELLTLDGFTRFAGSIVTLSHLYHGLVFMQR